MVATRTLIANTRVSVAPRTVGRHSVGPPGGSGGDDMGMGEGVWKFRTATYTSSPGHLMAPVHAKWSASGLGVVVTGLD